MRDRLIELIKQARNDWQISTMMPAKYTFDSWTADHLLANGVTAQEWISVKDRLPEKDGKYFVAWPNSLVRGKYVVCMLWYDEGVGFNDFDAKRGVIENKKVTHWMPLPLAPKGE